MGEAKRKKSAFKERVLKSLDMWDFPPSEAEAEAVLEISLLPIVRVTRWPEELLIHMRMPANQCHANTRFMVDHDPEKKIRQITGWWPQQGNFVLHSIIERDGVLGCVTPTPTAPHHEFDFIPDPDIEWREEPPYRVAYRKGLMVEPGLRSDPVENMRVSAIIRKRIAEGMDPFRAGEPPF